MNATSSFEDLIEIVRILRRECPWDRKQTHESIKDHLIEEAYEAVEAIDREDFDELRRELGDLLLHVVFHSTMASESGKFDVDAVIRTLQEKLIRRHPHVFGDAEAEDEEQVARNWERIKKEEGKSSALDGIPDRLPALIRAQRMQEKAANVGFDWPESDPVWDKAAEELEELRERMEEGDREAAAEEFGDFIFSAVNAARVHGLTAEDSLRLTIRKFERRFRYIEAELERRGRTLGESSLEEMNHYWEEAKKQN
ncbi:MAG: nucleoside triphosphate pyrophosphohydrolase [Balneolaceae bacterium]|nr:nucleoside triphosphate pyrophosphohydrolase [Balneolaceae bacterium]